MLSLTIIKLHDVAEAFNFYSVDLFCYLCLVCLSYCLCLFLAALWPPNGKGLTSCSLVCDVLLCFCHFTKWCPGSGVVFDCIDS